MSSAHGKVILLGEHAVVYGRPCLAAAVSPGAEVRSMRADVPSLTLSVSPWGASFEPGDGSDLGRALEALSAALDLRGQHLDATLHLPGGGGLGSSAALGVACARAVAEAAGKTLPEGALLDAALAWERVFHGNPSGVDHTLAALGGVGVFTRGEGLRRLSGGGSLRLLIGDTGERASTKDMVAAVARSLERRPEAGQTTLDAIAALVRNGALAFQAGDQRALGSLMDLNQALLASLLVSTERIELMCRSAREAGALGAKLTGAGGGGCVIALAGDREREVLDAWNALGAPATAVEIGP